jgi:glycosyltransferase involved in cell wall biosynthesis
MLRALVAKGLKALGVSTPKVIIDAPDFTHLHSGVRCLHGLCDRLNTLGIDSAVTSQVVSVRAWTPRISRAELATFPSLLDRAIVIYPEVTEGNPLGAKNVVRYLLNKPGFFTGRGLEANGPGDYYIHFADEFRPDGLTSRLVRLPLVDTTVFSPSLPQGARRGFIVYSDRYQPSVQDFPAWIDSPIVVSRSAPRGASTMAGLYRNSRALIAGERTGALTEALHCHCPVILLTNGSFAHEPLISRFNGHGFVLGFDRERLAQATVEAVSFPAVYAAQYRDVDRQILDFIADATRHFSLR